MLGQHSFSDPTVYIAGHGGKSYAADTQGTGNSRMGSHRLLSLHSRPVEKQLAVVLGVSSTPQLLGNGDQAIPHQEDASNQAKGVGGGHAEAKHIAGG